MNRLCFLLYVVLGSIQPAVQSDLGQPHIINWKEHGDNCSLQYILLNKNNRCSLNFKFHRQSQDDTWTSERTDTYNNMSWAEIKLAVLIRLKGSPGPQLLVKLYRPNWLDYELYTTNFNGVEKGFSFSCRDEGAIKWIASNGELRRFITYDRFAPPPASLMKRLPIGTRLQLQEEWLYDTDLDRWVATKRQWVKYPFGKPFAIPAIMKPTDCDFRYK